MDWENKGSQSSTCDIWHSAEDVRHHKPQIWQRLPAWNTAMVGAPSHAREIHWKPITFSDHFTVYGQSLPVKGIGLHHSEN
jgi:hypothetical protein